MKRFISFLAVLSLMIISLSALVGCEKKKTDIAFISSGDTEDAGSAAANCFAGIVSYSDANGLSYKTYSGSCEEQLRAAHADGAEIMVLFAVNDKAAVYNLAGKYTDIKFICIDFGNDFTVRPNIYCVNTQKVFNGIYAGYSAVKEGHKIIGIQGEATAETYNYLKGFIEGAQMAAVDIGVSQKPIRVYYNVSGSDMTAERSQSWYENECSLILCSDISYSEVYKNISQSDLCSVMTFGADRISEDERIIASVYSDYGTIIGNALNDVYSGQFKGGIMYFADAADGVTGFSYDKDRFSTFSESDLAKIEENISVLNISDSSVYKTPSDKGYSKIVIEERGIITD